MRNIIQPDSIEFADAGASVRRVHVSRVSVFTSIPYIRLKGKWLRDAGFSFCDEIEVHVYDRRLVVCIPEPLKIDLGGD